MGNKILKRKVIFNKSESVFKAVFRFVTAPRPILNSFLTTVLSLAGLGLAVKTYYDQQDSGTKQQAALDASRGALESVVNLSKGQMKVLEQSKRSLDSVVKTSQKEQEIIHQNLIVSKEQLITLKQQWKDEQQRLGQKPVIELRVWGLTKQEIQKEPRKVKLDSNGWLIVPITIRNQGNATAINVIFYGVTTPNTVRISDSKSLPSWVNDELHPNIFVFNLNSKLDIPPFKSLSFPHLFNAYIHVPKEENTFLFTFHAFASNSASDSVKINMVID